jgi:hypothetical protein
MHQWPEEVHGKGRIPGGWEIMGSFCLFLLSLISNCSYHEAMKMVMQE